MEAKLILDLVIKYGETYWLAAFIVSSWVLLIGFFFYATVEASWNRLKIGIKILVLPVVLFFGVLDILFDAIFGSIMYLEFPFKHWFNGRFTFSQRCEYHWDAPGYRGVIADAYCFLLNSILPGHCKK